MCLVDETVVVDGEAVLMVNRRTEVLDAAAAKGNGRAKDAVPGGPTATN